MTKFSSVFLGTPEFSIPSIEATFNTTRLLAAITQPDRPRGRGQKLSPCPVKEWALLKKIECFAPASLRKASIELEALDKWMLQNERPDFLVVTAYGNILPQRFLDWPKIGAINVHTSLLPRWRGAAPIQRALEAGDVETGVSLQKMIFELDAGDILAEEKIELGTDMDAETLTNTLSKMGGVVLQKFLESFQLDKLIGHPQDSSKITFAKKIEKTEGFYSDKLTAQELHNKIRAFCIWPGVKAELDGVQIKLVKSRVPDSEMSDLFSEKAPYGSLLKKNNRVFTRCYDNVRTGELCTLELLKIQFPGKQAIAASDALRNHFAKSSLLQLKSPESPVNS